MLNSKRSPAPVDLSHQLTGTRRRKKSCSFTMPLAHNTMRRRVLFAEIMIPLVVASSAVHGTRAIDTSWHAPAETQLNNLTSALGSNGVYGFIFNSSNTPQHEYGVYNWCNMPHVRPTEYVVADKAYELQYVELVCSGAYVPRSVHDLEPLLPRLLSSISYLLIFVDSQAPQADAVRFKCFPG